MNIMQIMKQVQAMQQKMEKIQDELKDIEINHEIANGAIKIVCNGQKVVKSIKIDAKLINPENPEAVDSDNLEILEDLILTVINEGMKKASDIEKEKTQALTKGLNLNIPGLL